MIRSGAVGWHNNYLIPATPYKAPQKKWMKKSLKLKNWRPQDPRDENCRIFTFSDSRGKYDNAFSMKSMV